MYQSTGAAVSDGGGGEQRRRTGGGFKERGAARGVDKDGASGRDVFFVSPKSVIITNLKKLC